MGATSAPPPSQNDTGGGDTMTDLEIAALAVYTLIGLAAVVALGVAECVIEMWKGHKK